jgi:hypothetical protein
VYVFCVVTVVGVYVFIVTVVLIRVLFCDSCKSGKKLEITVPNYAWTYRKEVGCIYLYSPIL